MVGKRSQGRIILIMAGLLALVLVKYAIDAFAMDTAQTLTLFKAVGSHVSICNDGISSVKDLNGTCRPVSIPKAPECTPAKTRKVLSHYPANGTGITVDISRDFDFSTFNSFCTRSKDMIAIIPVYSAAGNFDRRTAIRNTIGKDCIKHNCKVFFVVGVSCTQTVYTRVKDEFVDKKDVLMNNKIDTYWDLNNKAVAMLDFLIKFCPRPKYVLHIVDDTYPNIGYFLANLNRMKTGKFIMGHILQNFKAHRDTKIKGFVSKEEYPHQFYPDYVMGLAYAFLNSDSKLLLDKAYSADYIWIEDVWLTGLVRLEAGFEALRPNRTHRLCEKRQDRKPWINDVSNVWNICTCLHKAEVQDFYEIYKKTKH